MKYFKCPNCEDESISLLKKAFLDVRSKYKCKQCNTSYGVPWYAGILALATVGGFYYTFAKVQNVTIKILLCVLIVTLSILINTFIIPVIRK